MSPKGAPPASESTKGLRLTVLGSGTCELRAEASSPAHLVSAGGTHLVMDLGQGALRRLMQAGVAPVDLSAVLLTHHHLDHMADLLPLLFAANYDPAMKERARLTLAAHHGLAEVLSSLEVAFDHWLTPTPPVVSPLWLTPGEQFTVGPITVACASASHMETSLAYRLTFGSASLVYLGDSEAHPGLVEFCTGASLLLVNCASTDEHPKPGHLGARAAGELAAAAKVGGLLLSHLYSDVDPRQSLASAQEVYEGPLWLAADLMRLAIDGSGVCAEGRQGKKSAG